MEQISLKPRRYRFKRTNQIFVFHHLSFVERNSLVEEWKKIDERRQRRQLPLCRSIFLKYHQEMTKTRRLMEEFLETSHVKDVGEAKQWYWVMKNYPFDFKTAEWRAEELRLGTVARRLALEALEWAFCSERQAFLEFLNGKYFKSDIISIRKLEERPIKKLSRNMQKELAKADSLICTEIRIYFETRKGLIFQLEELQELTEATPKDWKNLLVKQINKFTKEIKQKFMNRVPKKETKKKMFEITLLQETTKAAFMSIQAYQKLLQTGSNLVVVDCHVVDNRLSFNLGHIKEQFKAPITALSRIEWTRFSPDDIDDMAERAGWIISSQLDPEKLFQHPVIMNFAQIIADEKIPSNYTEEELLEAHRRSNLLKLKMKKLSQEINSQLFKIRLSTVWTTIQQRLKLLLQELTARIRKGFTDELLKLQEEFRRFDRSLLFRSINPALMLANKAVVNQILSEEIGPSVKKLVALYDRIFTITQQISLDPTQHDLLISLAGFRIVLPSQIRDHQHFFQKRITSFQAYVNRKQATVLASAQQLAERLKILQTFANPQEAEAYKEEIGTLTQPLADLITEIDDLNKFEEVVDMIKTEIPRMRQIASDVRVMEELFVETKAYYDHVNEFFDSRRTAVNIPKSRNILETYLSKLAQFETQLTGQRAARHFISNARNDVDLFKKNFAVAEVLSCKRFLDQHWTKMSEIVGFDLSIHANSTMAVICELGLDDVLGQLKPIAFAAEREASISDQLDTAVGHWTKAMVETRPSAYWSLELPSNLPDLIFQAEKHKILLSSSKDSENPQTILSHEINKWLATVTKMEKLFIKWNSLLEDWLRVARIFEYSKAALQNEYLLFRRCAKYWRRFERLLRQDSSALHFLEIRHAGCWLIHVEEDMKIVIKGVHKHLNVIRLANPRLCLTADHELLQLFAATSIKLVLPILHREAFPQLRRLFFNHKTDQLEMADFQGQILPLPSLLGSKMDQLGVQEFIQTVEQAFLGKVNELLLVDPNDRSKIIPKMVGAVADSIENRITGDTISIVKMESNFHLHHKVLQTQSRLSMDFIHLDEMRRLPLTLCSHWAKGGFILLSGDLKNSRYYCQIIAQRLFSSIRYVNCHEKLKSSCFETLVQVSQRESPIIVLENIDELNTDAFHDLNTMISRFGKGYPFPRLFLTSPTSSELKTLSPSIVIENVSKRSQNDLAREQMEELVPYATMSPISSPTYKKTDEIPIVHNRTSREHLAEDLDNLTVSTVVGPMAKSCLQEIIESTGKNASWLYVDMLTDEQLISPGSGFGSQVAGQLLSILTPSSNFIQKEPPLSSRSETDVNEEEVEKGPTQFVIFYGNEGNQKLLPFISPLLCRYDGNLLPRPYLTLFDGSAFLPTSNIHCILCVPENLQRNKSISLLEKFDLPFTGLGEEAENGLADVYKQRKGKIASNVGKSGTAETLETLILQVIEPLIAKMKKSYTSSILLDLIDQELTDLKGNLTEILVQGTAVLAGNYLQIHVPGEEVDKNMAQNWMNAFGKTFSPLPEDVTSWKLSIEDPSTLVRWEDEPFHISVLEKESRLEELIVVWPNFDRLLHFGKRILTMGNCLLVTGKPFTQKTILVKMLQKQLPSACFEWIPNYARIGLENCQAEFAKILETPFRGDQRFLVIDKFSSCEPLLPVIEYFVDQQMFFSEGQLKKSSVNLKFILLCEEDDWQAISKAHSFFETFCHLPMGLTTTEEARQLVERLLQWNLTTKSFSSEYNKLVEPMANSIVSIASRSYVNFAMLPVCKRLIKGMFYAFPDNSPDTLAYIRLWLHETLRIIGDSIDPDKREEFLKDLRALLLEEFGFSERQVLYSGDGEHTEEQTGSLEELLYSELDNNESFDGLNYLPVRNLEHFNRTVENILFEHHRNHSRDRIQLAVNEWSMTYMQCILRILRQAGEHFCLAGPPGIGRQQAAKLAAAACSATIFHHYPDTSSEEAFRKGWAEILLRAVLSISSSNQPLLLMAHMDFTYGKMQPRWMEFIRLWLERPEFDSLSDEQLVSIGEQIIENEKSLVSHMQSQGVRLPGQRLVRFLTIEVLKEPETLRRVLEARIHDLLHVVFMVSPENKKDFSWCSVIHFKSPGKNEISSMTTKILTELKLPPAEDIGAIFKLVARYLKEIKSESWSEKLVVDWNILFHLCDEFQSLYSIEKKHLHRRSTRLSEALGCVSKIQNLERQGKSVEVAVLAERISTNERRLASLNKEFHEMNEHLDNLQQKVKRTEYRLEKMKTGVKLLDAEIGDKLKKPREDFQQAASKISHFGQAQFKQFSLIQRPGLGARFVAEVLRHLLTEEFKPKRNTMDTWQESQKFLRSPGLQHRILQIDPMVLELSLITILKKYIEHREFKEGKIEGDSELAAGLCGWTDALIQLAITSSLLKEKQLQLTELQQETAETETQIIAWKKEIEGLQEEIVTTEKTLRDLEISLTNDRKLKDYQNRAGPILEALGPFHRRTLKFRWQLEKEETQLQEQRLFASCVLLSVFRIMLANEQLATKMTCIEMVSTFLKSKGHDVANSTVPQLMTEVLRTLFTRRAFTLLIDAERVFLPLLDKFYPNATAIDMAKVDWRDPSITGSFIRHIYSGATTVYYNIQQSLPVEYYMVLSKWEEKEVRFSGRLLELPDDCRLIFIADHQIYLEPQLKRIMNIVIVNEQLEVLEPLAAEQTNSLFELLGESSASEILESHDITRKVIQEAESSKK